MVRLGDNPSDRDIANMNSKLFEAVEYRNIELSYRCICAVKYPTLIFTPPSIPSHHSTDSPKLPHTSTDYIISLINNGISSDISSVDEIINKSTTITHILASIPVVNIIKDSSIPIVTKINKSPLPPNSDNGSSLPPSSHYYQIWSPFIEDFEDASDKYE